MLGSIDMGGTNTALALARDDGRIVAERSVPTQSEEGPIRVLSRAAEELSRLGAPITAVGVGLPGLVDLRRGYSLFLPNMPGNWRDVPVAQEIGRMLGCRVAILNDVRMATLGELRFGLGREVSDMLFFAVGTGIGGGVVLDGKLRTGRLGAAGEMGHQTMLPDGPLCGCGNRGCLETLASGPAITAEGVRLMRSGLAPDLHRRAAGDAGLVTPALMAEAHDDSVRDAIRRAAWWLGTGIANAISTLHPELVAIGGGVSALGQPWLDPIRRTVIDRVRMFPAGDVRIEFSALGEKAGLFGGIALAMQAEENRWITHTAT